MAPTQNREERPPSMMPATEKAPAIRNFRPEDRDGVIALILPIQQEEFGIPVTLADQPDLREISSFYQSGRGGFWVAETAGGIVGSVGLKDIGDGQAVLRKMFVSAAYRGAPFRTASLLLEALLVSARAKGVREVLLGTTEQFLGAHRFYEKHGFHPLPAEHLPSSFPRMAVDTRFYILALQG